MTIRVFVFVEGQTEETFVNQLLLDHLAEFKIVIIPILFRSKPGYKGGVSSYEKIKNQILILLKQQKKDVFVTTMIDYYGLPSDFPKPSNCNLNDPMEVVKEIESSFSKDINFKNFIPYLMLHEFEGLLFSNVKAFEALVDKKVVSKLLKERNEFPSPEHINNNVETAPSKRIKRLYPKYAKPLHGPQIALEIGLGDIRKECLHFNRWLTLLELLQNDFSVDPY